MSENGVERDKLFDHEYDGIREYDNPMPKWWVYLFALSTAFAFPYVVHYHFGQGSSVFDALEAEQAAYANRLMETYGDLKPDASTLVRFMDDDLAMIGMAGLFKGKCSQCHLSDGSGSVGPNLTDNRWLNVKQITDIPQVLGDGLVNKGMPAWGDKLTQTQIVLLSSYVARLGRTPVAGKQPQGDPVEPWLATDDGASPPVQR